MFLVETIPVVSISKVTVKHSNYFTPLVTNAWDFLTFIFFFFLENALFSVKYLILC